MGRWWRYLVSFFSSAEITQDIVDNGIVQVFIQYGNQWWVLPDINGINSTQYGFGVERVQLFNANSDLTQPANPGDKTFRIVIISASNKKANPNLNWGNYNEIKKVYNLVD